MSDNAAVVLEAIAAVQERDVERLFASITMSLNTTTRRRSRTAAQDAANATFAASPRTLRSHRGSGLGYRCSRRSANDEWRRGSWRRLTAALVDFLNPHERRGK
jgi:hypothetical protein